MADLLIGSNLGVGCDLDWSEWGSDGPDEPSPLAATFSLSLAALFLGISAWPGVHLITSLHPSLSGSNLQ